MTDFTYHKDIDALEFYRDGSFSRKNTLRYDDLIFHISEENEVFGVEVINASQNLEISMDELDSIEEAEIEGRVSGDNLMVKLRIVIQKSSFWRKERSGYTRDIERRLPDNPVAA